MCYDIKASTEAQLKRAQRHGDSEAVEEIMEQLIPMTDLPLFHASGFTHPAMLVYTDRSPFFPEVATWGLVPHWIKDEVAMKKSWNTTLNARGESIFQKKSFRDAARSQRCLIEVDGFYEHHHFEKKTYPFFVSKKDGSSMLLAGLYNDWTNPATGAQLTTFTIVTTVGNNIMAKIHNNPKLEGPRMPLILPEELADNWLQSVRDEVDVKGLKTLIQSFPEDELDAYTVHKLRGKEYKGNTTETCAPHTYTELVF